MAQKDLFSRERDLDLKLKKEKYDDLWHSCCGLTLDRRATLFFSQLSIAISVIGFCIWQLLHSHTCEKDALYSGLLTLVIGVYLPQPNLH